MVQLKKGAAGTEYFEPGGVLICDDAEIVGAGVRVRGRYRDGRMALLSCMARMDLSWPDVQLGPASQCR